MDNELTQDHGVQIFIFTGTAGLIGGMGHNLKLQAKKFSIKRKSDGSGLSTAVVDANSVVCVCAISKDERQEELPGALSGKDLSKIDSITRAEYVLEAAKFPQVIFEAVAETADTIDGVLTLHGTSQLVKCTKERREDCVVVRFGIEQTKFGMTPYYVMGGALAVADTVKVEVQFPAAVRNLLKSE